MFSHKLHAYPVAEIKLHGYDIYVYCVHYWTMNFNSQSYMRIYSSCSSIGSWIDLKVIYFCWFVNLFYCLLFFFQLHHLYQLHVITLATLQSIKFCFVKVRQTLLCLSKLILIYLSCFYHQLELNVDTKTAEYNAFNNQHGVSGVKYKQCQI